MSKERPFTVRGSPSDIHMNMNGKKSRNLMSRQVGLLGWIPAFHPRGPGSIPGGSQTSFL